VGLISLIHGAISTAEGPAVPQIEVPSSVESCPPGSILSSGPPDPGIFSSAASSGLRGYWCEVYDARGVATRTGQYWEADSEGVVRTRGTYVASRLAGPVVAFHENGQVFVTGFLEDGEWDGRFELFDESGSTWFRADFQRGRLDGLVRTFHPDGKLASEARYRRGREDGLARSFYASAAGGRLKSEAHLEADQLVGTHRLFDRTGALTRFINWQTGRHPWPSATSSTDPSTDGATPPAARAVSENMEASLPD
jgi:hypothetical protein